MENFKKFQERDMQIARQLSDFVNGGISNERAVAAVMACDHRYLQNEWFKVFYYYTYYLALNYERGCYDPRNEWACKMAKQFVDGAPDFFRSEYQDKEMMEYLESVFFNK